MEAVALEHVAVLTDCSSPHDEAVVQAMEWSTSLRLPLEVLNAPSSTVCCPTANGRPATSDKLIAAGFPQTCPQGAMPGTESRSLLDQLFRPHGLTAFSSALPSEVKRFLVNASLKVMDSAILICSSDSRCISRVLILHDAQEGEIGFLHSALSLCRLFEVTPVILTLASSETYARRSQRVAEEACLHFRLPALFDYVVGLDLRTAVYSIARWRRCSHVFLPRRQSIPWWRWPRRGILKLLLGSDSSLSLLALPESGIRTPEITLQRQIAAGSLHPC